MQFKRIYLIFFFLLYPLTSHALLDSNFDLSNADVKIDGRMSEDHAGMTVESLGDINGDGFGDFAIRTGLSSHSTLDPILGIFFGKTTSDWASSLSINNADVQITTGTNGALIGTQIGKRGDVNGDGIDDIVISTSNVVPDTTYIIYGKTSGWSSAPVDTMANASFISDLPGYEISSVSISGDFNGDGIDDIALGAPGYDPPDYDANSNLGRIFIFFGSVSGWPLQTNISNADLAYSMPIPTNSGRYDFLLGYEITLVGDLDQDGFDDLVTSEPEYFDVSPMSRFGRIHIFAGNNLGILSPILTYNCPVWTGYNIEGVNDVNNDGYPDFWTNTTYQSAYLFHGGADIANMSVSTIFDTTSFTVTWSQDQASSGDVNGDGIYDLLLGDRFVALGNYTGEAYLLYGHNGGWGSNFDLLNNYDVRFISEGLSYQTGYAVDLLDDVNGDGKDDILIGAPFASPSTTHEGRSYLIFGDEALTCNPINAVYVDAVNGTPTGPGGISCPFDTINGGIQEAKNQGIDQVIVLGWFYPEIVMLEPGIQVQGQLRNGFLPPFIVGSLYPPFIVHGAHEASLNNFIIYEGGVELDGTNLMHMQENIFFINTSTRSMPLHLTNGASDNTFQNNIFYHKWNAYYEYAIWIESNCDDNQFINNTIHIKDYHNSFPNDVIGIQLENFTHDNVFLNNIIQGNTHCYNGGNGPCATKYGILANGTNITTITDYNLLPVNNPGITLGTGNIFGFASFNLPMSNGFNYMLGAGSDAIDAGDPNTIYNDPNGTPNDMGAFGGPNSLDFQ
ncbi:MAG: integrin alpha [Chlamydiota bacterium]|nr:integrin alpha [Chlamydiota bacterium]